MGLISLLWGIVSMLWMVLALIPLLGWGNWFLIPFAAVGAIIAAIGILFTRTENRGRAKAGLLLNVVVIVASWESITSRVNMPGVAPTPMIAVGFSDFTAPRKSATGAWSCAYGFLCSASPPRLATTSPFESTIQQRWRACSNAWPKLVS